jgi:arylformamidase
MSEIIDISVPLHEKLPFWPGSPGVKFEWRHEITNENPANVSTMTMDVHTGTHIDAPLHFVKDGKSTSDIPLEKMIGKCFVLEILNKQKISSSDIVLSLKKAGLDETIPSKILLKTENSFKHWNNFESPFEKNYCSLSEDAAAWVAKQKLDLIGIDYHSIQLFEDGPLTHQLILGAEVVVLEGINLKEVESGWYELYCLPLKILGREGAPARAILKRI